VRFLFLDQTRKKEGRKPKGGFIDGEGGKGKERVSSIARAGKKKGEKKSGQMAQKKKEKQTG